jgi:uncharacterized protein YqhQ
MYFTINPKGEIMDISIVLEFFAQFALNNPKLAGICSIAYLIGLGAKTLREAAEKFVLDSPSKEDDKKLEEVKKNPIYKGVSVVLDFLFRLKKPESK